MMLKPQFPFSKHYDFMFPIDGDVIKEDGEIAFINISQKKAVKTTTLAYYLMLQLGRYLYDFEKVTYKFEVAGIKQDVITVDPSNKHKHIVDYDFFKKELMCPSCKRMFWIPQSEFKTLNKKYKAKCNNCK